MQCFQIMDFENFQHFEYFKIISYTYFLDILIQKEISYLLL